MQKKTKIEQVRQHFIEYGKLTNWECIQKYRYTKLADAVYKLKKQGMNIITVMHYKDGTSYAEYVYVEEQKGETK